MTRRKLPTGIQTFRKLREDDCYYVDKTAFILRLTREGKHYFLSRPRRFGKSLLVDTIKELFEGSEELFRGLHVHDHWEWSKRRPVVRLDFGGGDYAAPDGLQEDLADQLTALETAAGVSARSAAAPIRFRRLLEALHRSAGRRVAVLVDEYDKPILDALRKPAVAAANRRLLRSLYSNVKFADAHIHFTLLTGVSKFSKVSVFSGLNNLIDITLEPEFSAICGYTEADLDTVFAAELPGLDRDEIRDWYNGYNWLGEERVYNPFDTSGTRATTSRAMKATMRVSAIPGSRPRDWTSRWKISSSRGRVDLAVRYRGNVYLFEFKVVEMAPEGAALAQLQARGYAEKYRALGEPIHLLGVEFSRDARNIAAFEVARA